MIEKLGFLVRFWELKARHATLGHPLSAGEQLELLSLMQLVTGDFKLPEPGPIDPEAGMLPAQLIGEGKIVPVEIRCVTASGLVVAASRTMPQGERVIVRAADAVSGVEYALPCSVLWRFEAAPSVMALVVDGIPTRSEFGPPIDAQARSALAIGRHERFVG